MQVTAVYENLTVLKDVGLKPNGKRFDRYWLCRCRCGTVREFLATRVKYRRVKSCGCTQTEPKLQPGEAMANYFYNVYRQNARRRKLTFDLTREEFGNLTSSPCHYCGDPPAHVVQVSYPDGRPKSQTAYVANGVDRADNVLGYVQGNCVPCCDTCNQMKKALSVEFFLDHAAKIVKHQEVRA